MKKILSYQLALFVALLTLALGSPNSVNAQPKNSKAVKKASAVKVSKPVIQPAPVSKPVLPEPVREVVYQTDLSAINNDQLEITCTAPTISSKQVIYRFPAMVPGTYHVYDFGRWISGMKAISKNGQPLPVNRLDANSWQIDQADELGKIIYRVSDTFDSSGIENIPFEPAGSLISKDTVVLINTFCYTGYFDGYKNLPIKFHVKNTGRLTATSSLDDLNPARDADLFTAPNYVVWADHPIYYTSNNDILVNQVGNAKVQLAVYDNAGKVKAADLYPKMEKMLKATSDFFGGQLPVKKYSFLIYYTGKPTITQSQGALEHTTSSVYVMMSDEPASAASVMQEIASHEFFHIITPLNIHSEEIGDFDFAKPTMSKHLWLYEGCTEYMSSYILFKQGVKTSQEYILQKLRTYMIGSGQFNDTLPFTEMSLNVLGETEKQYSNVYLKGPLINLCLDLKLRKLSNGTYGLPDLIKALSLKYGPDRSFKDPELFDEIAKLSGYPEIRTFFADYVEGPKPLPLQEVLSYVGVTYQPPRTGFAATMGNITFRGTPTDEMFVESIAQMNDVGKSLGYKEGDIVKKINDDEVRASTFGQVVAKFRATAQKGDKFTVTVLRDGKEKVLKAKVDLVQVQLPISLTIDKEIASEKLNLWNAWSGNSAR